MRYINTNNNYCKYCYTIRNQLSLEGNNIEKYRTNQPYQC